MSKKLDQIINDFKEELSRLLSISFGVFLFVLFFRPFSFTDFDFNNSLLFVGGLGLIVFLIMVLVRITIPGILRRNNPDVHEFFLPSFFNGIIIFLLSSLAFVFYLRYVGLVGITFFITFKVVLICLAPPLALALIDLVNELKQQNEVLIVEKKIMQKQVEKYEEDILNKSIEFPSENNSEKLTLQVSEVALIKSADNYVEIIYREGETYKKKLVRNTMKNIEQQIKQYSNFLRCHRVCIVNLHYIEKLNRSNHNHWLTIKGFNEPVPVSRQYLLKLKEAV
jgi:DNA-binding LytR/AlgR family response regulator